MTEHAPAYNLYQLWEQGELTDTEAMRALCVELAAVESEIGPLEESRAQLRTQIGHIAARLGDRIDVPGFGTVEITAPIAPGTSYEKKAIEALIVQLTREGQYDLAQRLTECGKPTNGRAGGLRITRTKGGEARQ